MRSQISRHFPFFPLAIVVHRVEGDLVARSLTRECGLSGSTSARMPSALRIPGGGSLGFRRGRPGLGQELPLVDFAKRLSSKEASGVLQPCSSWAGPRSQLALNVYVILVKKRKGKGSCNFPGHRQLKSDTLVQGVLLLRKAGREKEKERRKVCGKPFRTRGQQEALSIVEHESSVCTHSSAWPDAIGES